MIPLPVLYGKVFRKWKKFLDESQWWSKSEIEEYQIRELSTLLNHAYNNVPYYKSLFEKEKIKPSDIDDFDRLSIIPPLTRTKIQNNLSKIKAKNYPSSKFQRVATSGSTTEPLSFYIQKKKSEQIENAFQWRYRNIIGVNYKNEYIYLTGINLNTYASNGEEIWSKYFIPLRIFALSSFHLTDYYLEKYVKAINERPHSILFGFPSSLYMLAKYMAKNDLTFKNIKLTHTGSENLYPYQRSLMRKQFGSEIFDHYGHAEQCVFLHQCERANLYHVIPEYGITEIIDESGKNIRSEGKIGEMYGTSFMNYAFPFIRYKTGDMVEFSGKMCGCNRNFETIKSVQGRLQEFFIDINGKLIFLTAAVGALHEEIFKNLEKFQFYQDKKGVAILKIIPKKTYTDKDNETIMKALYSKMPNSIKIEIEKVDELSRTKAGKFMLMEQKLSIDDFLI